MTDQHDDGLEPASQDDEVVELDPPAADGLLLDLIHVLNGNPDGILGITVTVGGSIISGIAIGRDAWIDAQRARRGPDDGLDGLWNDYTTASAERTNPEFIDYFLHLKDATHVGRPGSVPANGGVLMRVRASEVSSWSLIFIGESEHVVDDDDEESASD